MVRVNLEKLETVFLKGEFVVKRSIWEIILVGLFFSVIVLVPVFCFIAPKDLVQHAVSDCPDDPAAHDEAMRISGKTWLVEKVLVELSGITIDITEVKKSTEVHGLLEVETDQHAETKTLVVPREGHLFFHEFCSLMVGRTVELLDITSKTWNENLPHNPTSYLAPKCPLVERFLGQRDGPEG